MHLVCYSNIINTIKLVISKSTDILLLIILYTILSRIIVHMAQNAHRAALSVLSTKWRSDFLFWSLKKLTQYLMLSRQTFIYMPVNECWNDFFVCLFICWNSGFVCV